MATSFKLKAVEELKAAKKIARQQEAEASVAYEEKKAAKEARDFVSNLVFNKFVRLENVQSEKYGRILADVFIDDIHLNELLIKEGHAVEYHGGTKTAKVRDDGTWGN